MGIERLIFSIQVWGRDSFHSKKKNIKKPEPGARSCRARDIPQGRTSQQHCIRLGSDVGLSVGLPWEVRCQLRSLVAACDAVKDID